jgi:hypothetical protein
LRHRYIAQLRLSSQIQFAVENEDRVPRVRLNLNIQISHSTIVPYRYGLRSSLPRANHLGRSSLGLTRRADMGGRVMTDTVLFGHA